MSDSDYVKLIDAEPWGIGGDHHPDHPPVSEHLEQIAASLFASPSVENPELPAGYTYFGQFVNHDLSFQQSPTRNARSPRLDLDSVYGGGPLEHPHLYEFEDFERLAVAYNGQWEHDLPRTTDPSGRRGSGDHTSDWRRAIIADPRNDENVIIAQLHLAMIRLHNHFVLECVGVADRLDIYKEARRQTTWHYQYVVVEDLLRRLCPEHIWEDAFQSRTNPAANRYFRPGTRAFIPLEFSLAALRVGHSMVREEYVLAERLKAPGGQAPLRMPLFHRGSRNLGLVGGRTLPKNWSLQWDLFVEHAGSAPQKAMRFDDCLSKPLQALPADGPLSTRSLALRTLQAGARAGLASGCDVAKALGFQPLQYDGPLWPYLLIESRDAGGCKLGPCAAQIVAETIFGLLQADPESYLNVAPRWSPTPGARFGLAELLSWAGMPMTAAALS
jgi:hypothetical protein